MYTILWTETDKNGKIKDRWERAKDRREVASLLIREGLQDNEDVMIFSPEAEDYLVSNEDIFASL